MEADEEVILDLMCHEGGHPPEHREWLAGTMEFQKRVLAFRIRKLWLDIREHWKLN